MPWPASRLALDERRPGRRCELEGGLVLDVRFGIDEVDRRRSRTGRLAPGTVRARGAAASRRPGRCSVLRELVRSGRDHRRRARSVARRSARDGRQERAAGGAGQAAVRHRFAALAALDRPGRHPRTSARGTGPAALVGLHVGRRGDGGASHPVGGPRTPRTSSVRGRRPWSRPPPARRRRRPSARARRSRPRRTGRPRQGREWRPNRRPGRVPTAGPRRGRRDGRWHEDDDQDQRREPEAHDGRQGMAEARPDPAAQGDPRCRRGRG